MSDSVWEDVARAGRAVVMAPVEIAHLALEEMFGSDDELRTIAAELRALGREVEELRRRIDASVGRISWHGRAADAFTEHARGRIRDLAAAADGLEALGASVGRLADAV
ncbi:hypothetical protein [Streptacidiphilus sp. ASG 303]|uniref:hypothetical protein n=1 Tax=Streptomycetaceae TaxID=2062 RepID=UPI001E298381|nr:hypothetical protein [Streptacidiphilus sp. ASG 303]MCD0482147.1 hypothetical protein [Streptacidiphilus sp. ASG 303]